MGDIEVSLKNNDDTYMLHEFLKCVPELNWFFLKIVS